MPPPDNADDVLVLGRRCDSCTLCCKVLSIEELAKPKGNWCSHCDVGRGCRIYEQRPVECRNFYCGFLTVPDLSEEWRPSKSKIVLVSELDGVRIAAHVDPARPDAWRKEPFYSKLKEWAIAAAASQCQVVICIGKRTIVVLPDREVDLGIIEDDELIVTEERAVLYGLPILIPFKIKRDDPRAALLKGGETHVVVNVQQNRGAGPAGVRIPKSDR